MVSRHRLVVIWSICVIFLGNLPARADNAYRLGPQDQVQVKVSDLRAGTGEAYQWKAFEGEFIVSASGSLSLPVVGEVEAAGRTTSEIEAVLAAKLQTKAGLAAQPDAAVQIVKYRPFYVMGSVEKPGDYAFRPNLTVLQAVSVAGGYERVSPETLRIYLRDAVSSRGDLRELAVSRLGLLARQARLDAEIKETATITFPDEVLAHAGEPGISRVMREEQLFFESRRNGLQAQITTLTKNKQFLESEIESLNAKSVNIGRQLDLTRAELDRVTGLVKQGLTVLPRQLEASQATAQLESNKIDTQLAVIKAHEDISRAERDMIDIRTTMRNDSLKEANEVRTKLAESLEKSRTAQVLLEQAESRAPMIAQAIAAEGDKLDYFISRRSDGRSQTIAVQEDDLVQPGDVVRVVPRLPKSKTDAPVAMSPTPYARSASDF